MTPAAPSSVAAVGQAVDTVARRSATASRSSRPHDGVDFNSYINRLVAKVRQNWIAVMPESVKLGDQGVVGITFRINSDGSFPPELLNLERTSGKQPLDTAALSAIRASSPFEPLPPQFKRPYIELRFGFYYNVKPPGSAQ